MAGEREETSGVPLVLPSKRAAEFADELHALARHAALTRDESEDMGDDLAVEALTDALALVERRLSAYPRRGRRCARTSNPAARARRHGRGLTAHEV